MAIPKMKRIKVSSEDELRNWLARNAGSSQSVMIVTCNKASPSKYISGQDVRQAIRDVGWSAGKSYTLDGNLVGHVASRG